MLSSSSNTSLKLSIAHLWALRVFTFAMPFSFFLLYFVAVILSSGVWWRIHMWLGTPFLAGVVCLMLSYLSLSPAPEGAPVAAGA
jgi:hypothetical protein